MRRGENPWWISAACCVPSRWSGKGVVATGLPASIELGPFTISISGKEYPESTLGFFWDLGGQGYYRAEFGGGRMGQPSLDLR